MRCGNERLISPDGPIIMKLDDGRTLEIEIPSVSQAIVSVGFDKVFEKNREIDVDKIMAPFIESG